MLGALRSKTGELMFSLERYNINRHVSRFSEYSTEEQDVLRLK
jgi:hypothetical protein